jgi:serine/threonine-protein kinase
MGLDLADPRFHLRLAPPGGARQIGAMSEIPTKLTSALADRYRIERELGAGGMATVYLADDLKHDRKVAIKVLRPELAAVVGAERFLAEIKTTANLQHPNILPLFDSGEADGFLFYVMPYVEGESLRDRLDREKQLRVEDAITLTRKVADALDYAHEKGVVHRDIKPANILISGRGEPLVADFGIALAVSQAGGGRITETGLSLGTPHYMSPEQATGDRDVDPRSDIYALGCVLYELLAGQPPFAAPTAQAVLARILTEQPRRVTELRRTVPPHIASVLARSLEKLPADRFESAQEFLDALDDSQYAYETEMVTAPFLPATRVATTGPIRSRTALVPALAAALVLAAFVAAAGWFRSPQEAEPAPTTRAVLADLPTNAPSGSGERLAISRDGSRLAVVSYDEGGRSLFWRNVNEFGRTRIEGVDAPGDPSFSPDGRWLAFDAGGMVQRAELPSGSIFPVVAGDYAHWGADDLMIFISGGGLYTVPPMGGEPTMLIAPDAEITASRPFLLPDGSGVLFQASGADPETGERALYVYEMESGAIVDLGLQGSNPKYVASGHLVFGRQDQSLVAVPFDLATLRPSGQPSTVLTDLTVYGGGAIQFAVSDRGTAFYELGGDDVGGAEELTVLGVDGSARVTAVGEGSFGNPRWSPSGTSVAYSSIESGTGMSHIYTYNVDLREAPRRITFEGPNFAPIWSPDGQRLAFVSARPGTDGADVFIKDLNDAAPPRSLGTLPDDQFPEDWPAENQLVVGNFGGAGANDGFMIVDPDSPESEGVPYFESGFPLLDLRVSPTGDLAVYVSDESGTPEVYLRSFPEPGQPELISFGGGEKPQWSQDGETIYYWARTNPETLMAADIRLGPPFAVLARDTITVFSGVDDLWPDVHPDGSRVLAVTSAGSVSDEGEREPARAVLVTNWFAELERLTGGGR